MFWTKKDTTLESLAVLLSDDKLKEDLLGAKVVAMPTPDQIVADANKLLRQSLTPEYKIWAKEAWSRVLNHLDLILDDRTPEDKVKYHRGALKATLDLLRVSYIAQLAKQESEAPQRP